MGIIGRGLSRLWLAVVYIYELIGWIFSAPLGGSTIAELKDELRKTNRDLEVLQEQLRVQRDEARTKRLEERGHDPAAAEDEDDEDDEGEDEVAAVRLQHGEALSQCRAHGPLNVELKGGGLLGMTRWRVFYAMLYGHHLFLWTDRAATEPYQVMDLRSAQNRVAFQEEATPIPRAPTDAPTPTLIPGGVHHRRRYRGARQAAPRSAQRG